MQGQYLHHGIKRLHPDTMPDFYREELEKFHQKDYSEDAEEDLDCARWVRINVQWRDSTALKNLGWVGDRV